MNQVVMWGSGFIGGACVAALAGLVYLANSAVIAIGELVGYADASVTGLAVAASRLFGL